MQTAIYLVDGVGVPRYQAVRTIMWGTRPIASYAECSYQLDEYQTIYVGGLDERGRPIGEIVRKVYVDDKRQLRRSMRNGGGD